MSRLVGRRWVAAVVTFALSVAGVVALAPAAGASHSVFALANPYVAQGQSHTVTILGTGFSPVAPNVSVSPSTGVTVSNVAFVSSTAITATITAAAGAPVGARDVTVNQLVVDNATCTGCLLITAPTSASPTSWGNGSNLQITVTGSGFSGGVTGVQLLNPSLPTLAATAVDVVDDTSLTADLPLQGAAPGRYVIKVSRTSGGPLYEGDTFVGGFVVNPPPTIASPATTPTHLSQGSSASLVVHGTRFATGAAVAFAGGNIVVGDSTVNSDGTALTVTVSIAGDAATGPRDVIVANPDSGTATAAGAFTVDPGTSLSSVSPNNAVTGTVAPIVLTGTGFTPGSTVTFSSTSITVNSVTVTSPTRIDVVVTVPQNAAPSSGTVTVQRNGGGSATALFTVVAADHTQRFVTAAYLSVLGRLPDRAGSDYFTNLIRGGASHTSVAATLYGSLEARRLIIATLFAIHLHRAPDEAGLEYYADQLLSRTIESIEIELTASGEYIGVRGQNDIDTYITAVYNDVLGRDPEPAGLAYWHGQLESGAPPSAVAGGIIFSDEAVGRVVAGGYQRLLGRSTDLAGLSYWVRQIQHGVRVEYFLSALIGSAEYDSHV